MIDTQRATNNAKKHKKIERMMTFRETQLKYLPNNTAKTEKSQEKRKREGEREREKSVCVCESSNQIEKCSRYIKHFSKNF